MTLYVQFWAPDDGRKTRLKHVERRTGIKKFRNVASCWLYCANLSAATHSSVRSSNIICKVQTVSMYIVYGLLIFFCNTSGNTTLARVAMHTRTHTHTHTYPHTRTTHTHTTHTPHTHTHTPHTHTHTHVCKQQRWHTSTDGRTYSFLPFRSNRAL